MSTDRLARLLWVTRVQLPCEQTRAGDGITGGRRNNPRGKRVWPLCSQYAGDHLRTELQSMLEQAAAGVAGRLEQLDIFERYGLAMFDSETTATSVSERLEAMEVQWTTNQRRADSGGPGTTALDAQGTCLVDFVPEFISHSAADALFQDLLCNTAWKGAKSELPPEVQPRQVCYMADDDSLAYTYGGQRWSPSPWSSSMHKLKQAVESACSGDTTFNSCLLNLYRDGSDHVPWHADDEPVYGDLTDCTIASVSLGAPRLFQIRQNSLETTRHARDAAGCDLRWKYILHSGSLLIMRGATQRHYQHRVPKRERRPVGPRINATFRTIKVPEAIGEPEAELTVSCSDDCALGEIGVGSGEDYEDEDDEVVADGVGAIGSRLESNSTGDYQGAQQRHIRFAARRLSERLFIGHGKKKLCPRGAAALQAAVKDAATNAVADHSSLPVHLCTAHQDEGGSLTADENGSALVSPHRMAVTLEMHRGYAFANLIGGDASRSASLRVITTLDGAQLHVPRGRAQGSLVDNKEFRNVASRGATTVEDDAEGYTLLLDVCPATQPVCKHFARAGSCRFGERCHFAHVG